MAAIRELGSPPHPSTPLPTPPAGRHPPQEPDGEPSPFARLVRGLAHETDRGEASLKGALAAGRAGVALDPTSLLALQAVIYRYAETMDLAAQLVEKASTGVKSIVQGQ